MIACCFFDSPYAVRTRVGEPVAATDGAGADRRHDPRHLRQSLLHSTGILVYLQTKPPCPKRTMSQDQVCFNLIVSPNKLKVWIITSDRG